MTNAKPVSVTLLYGGLAGLGMILFTLATYKTGPRAFISPVVYLMYLIPLVFGIVAALVEKRRGQGWLEFRSALRICFGILVLATVLQTVFTWLLVHVIDPGFGKQVGPLLLANMEANYRHFGMPEDEISRNLAAAQNEDLFSFSSMALGLARDYIIGFPVSLLLAVVLRRQKPGVSQHKTQ